MAAIVIGDEKKITHFIGRTNHYNQNVYIILLIGVHDISRA
jgi:hypothetical protein